ncbi:NUDIX domain-containing protein [Pseudooceanicola sp. 502str34]|uniref:NUDIX domain-containing protein n=1 Tax=Maritimibacter alkaliphilus TaxID=404236 RepID=UPI001C96F216|nr:NUDIX hydrolase [Maritimibacter alkaliphilus]MBY6090546.1 NUDIX hydrolase [Maritimibacter alkaliphilus]
MRRYGDTPRTDRTYTLRPGAYAILPRDGSLLLTHQMEPEPEFQLPGGGIDPGESAIRALHREVFEETGWTIAAPRRAGVYRRFVYMPEYDLHAEKVCAIYIARPVRRLDAPSEPGHLPVWMPAEDALALLPDPGSRGLLASVLGQI